MNKNTIPSLCIVLLLVTAYVSYFLYQAPSPKYDDAQFNLKIAEMHLEKIASAPHPIGTAEHNKVREYIADQAKSMGLIVKLDTLVDHQSRSGHVIISDIRNIIITKKGSNPKGTIAFAAHYDSQPNTPGAADDGAPVAAMLSLMETTKDKFYENDIVFIITDGEETGLSGASLFTTSNPLAPKLDYLFNFEARGNAGPVLGFEPNEKNNHIMDLFLDLDHSFASSLMYDVYRLMPNDTDFTHFKKLDIGGISLAMVDNYVTYHSMTDSPSNIDAGSFYHHGKLIAQLMDKLGNDSLENTHDYNMTYFNTLGSHSLQYRPYWNIVFWICSILLFLLYVPLVKKKKKITSILIGILGAISLIVGSMLVSYVLGWIIVKAYPHYSAFYDNNFYNSSQYVLCFLALSTLLFHFFAFSQKKKEDRVINFHLGGIIFLLIIAGISLVYIPTGSYFLVLPLFAFLLLQQLRRIVPNNRKLWIDAISLVVPIIVWSPLVYLFYIVFSLGAPFLPIAVYSFFLVLCLPILKEGPRLWSLILICLFVLAMIRGHMSSTISENQPYQANWFYLNDTNGERIITRDNILDKVEKKYFPDAQLIDNRFVAKSELGLISPITYTVTKDTLDKLVTSKIKISSDKEVLRVRIAGEVLTEAKNIELRGEKVKVRPRGGIQFYGDVKNKSMNLTIEYNEEIEDRFILVETVERGLIDKIAKDGTIIPGIGYNGGTIIHSHRIEI